MANSDQDTAGGIGRFASLWLLKGNLQAILCLPGPPEKQPASQVSVYQSRRLLPIAGVVAFEEIARLLKIGQWSGSVD